jgi:hypothetical protein
MNLAEIDNNLDLKLAKLFKRRIELAEEQRQINSEIGRINRLKMRLARTKLIRAKRCHQ